MTIVGVAPAGFEGTTLGFVPQVFVPITMRGRLEPHDRLVLAAAAMLLALVALTAGFVPAQRASNIDPIRALRTE